MIPFSMLLPLVSIKLFLFVCLYVERKTKMTQRYISLRHRRTHTIMKQSPHISLDWVYTECQILRIMIHFITQGCYSSNTTGFKKGFGNTRAPMGYSVSSQKLRVCQCWKTKLVCGYTNKVTRLLEFEKSLSDTHSLSLLFDWTWALLQKDLFGFELSFFVIAGNAQFWLLTIRELSSGCWHCAYSPSFSFSLHSNHKPRLHALKGPNST